MVSGIKDQLAGQAQDGPGHHARLAERPAQAQAAKNEAAGQAFLEENKKKPGVTVTASGLQIQITTPGTGKKPKPTSTVEVNYRGTLIDGKEFDSSYKRGTPATFPVNGVIKGWTEALQLMSVGEQVPAGHPLRIWPTALRATAASGIGPGCGAGLRR